MKVHAAINVSSIKVFQRCLLHIYFAQVTIPENFL
jgi:hypothetical protein